MLLFFFISYIECDFLITTFHLVEIMSELIYSKPVILVLLCCKICKVNLKSMLLPEDWKYETFEDVLLFPRMWSFIATHIYVEGKLLSTMISRRAFIMVGDLNQISITVTACFLSHLLSLLRRESFFFPNSMPVVWFDWNCKYHLSFSMYRQSSSVFPNVPIIFHLKTFM